jgi:hypothetical protein
MRNKPIIYLALASFLLCGCQALEKKQQSGAAVEVNGHYLYRSTLDSLTLGLNSEDSMRVTQQYISQWAKDILLYDNAKAQANSEIERMVEDYRRALYVHAYEEYLVERHMSKTVLDTTVAQIYAQMSDRFILDESIIHGILVVVPNDAPNIAKLRGWMSKKEMDNIEKYAYQNASGYELFDDKWLTTTDLLNHMPIERGDIENKLKSKDQVEMSDSLYTYILQVTDKYLRGSAMPIEYARPQIEKMVLHERQVDFLQKEREKLYNEAIQEQKIKFYEN